jgi:deoxycytidylate deaminase
MIINAKISKIYFIEGYPDELSKNLLAEANIPSEKIEIAVEDIGGEKK